MDLKPIYWPFPNTYQPCPLLLENVSHTTPKESFLECPCIHILKGQEGECNSHIVFTPYEVENFPPMYPMILCLQPLLSDNFIFHVGDGNMLADVGMDDDHCICVWDWRKQEKIASTR